VIKLKKINLSEGISDIGSPDLKYYAFDWDDNILEMPTEIILSEINGDEVGMSTEDFAEYRSMIGSENFDYKGRTIVGYAENPFRNFRVEGDKQFIIDSLIAKPGPSWDDFVECINGGSIFSIITARGHTPSVLKESVYNMIITNHMGIDINQVINNLKRYREIAGEEKMSTNELINYYLDLCRFYPVTYGEGSAANPEEGKIKALREFINYVKSISTELGKRAFFKNDVKNNFVPTIGFSDDDPKNIESMKSADINADNVDISMYLTKGGEKVKVKI
jgi:hypothetical protein